MKLLDLFCGLGGWSKGFAAVGFECVGVDIVDVGYPYKLILKDVRELDGHQFKGFDVIVGSPPCRDFSQTTTFGWKYWRDPPNPARGMELVMAFMRIVHEAKPHFWLLENVPGMKRYFNLKPRVETYLTPSMRRCFWGNFPPFLIYCVHNVPRIQDFQGRFRKWKRAEIPFPIAKNLALACRRKLEFV